MIPYLSCSKLSLRHCSTDPRPALSNLADQDPANHEASTSEVVHDGGDWSWDRLVEGFKDEEEPVASAIMH
jgi:hypothetical protein